MTARVVRCRLFTFAECFLDFFMSWLPFYFETKIILLLWLVHSNFSGAKFVYENFVDEVFHKHESDIDHSLAVCKAQVYLSPSLPPSLPLSLPPSLPPSFPPSLLPSLPPSLPPSLQQGRQV